MSEVLKFNKKREQIDSEKIRDRYKKDFKDFVLKREKDDKIYYFDTRKEMQNQYSMSRWQLKLFVGSFFMPGSWHKSSAYLLYNNDMGLEIYHWTERK